jgi:hypothetical protein
VNVASQADYSILSPTVRTEVRADVRAYQNALKTSSDPAEVTTLFHEFMAAYVPHAMAAQGC